MGGGGQARARRLRRGAEPNAALELDLDDGTTERCPALMLLALGYDREMVPAPGSMFLEGMPDFECTFDMTDIRPGW